VLLTQSAQLHGPVLSLLTCAVRDVCCTSPSDDIRHVSALRQAKKIILNQIPHKFCRDTVHKFEKISGRAVQNKLPDRVPEKPDLNNVKAMV
jgi:hypothetical protein